MSALEQYKAGIVRDTTRYLAAGIDLRTIAARLFYPTVEKLTGDLTRWGHGHLFDQKEDA